MWAFFSRRLRMWLLLAIALPLAGPSCIAWRWPPSAVIRLPEQRRRCTRPTLRSPPPRRAARKAER